MVIRSYGSPGLGCIRIPFGGARAPSAVSGSGLALPQDPVNILSGHSDHVLTPVSGALKAGSMTTMSPRIRIGSAPDSWGVWFPDDPRQVPWRRFLDEVAEAGYEWIELGPYGYLPTDPDVLAQETGRRGLKVSAGDGLHGPAPRPRRLGRDVGARLGHRRTHARDRRRASRRHPRVLAGRQDGRGHRGLLAHGGAVARPDHPDRAARPRGPRAVRPADRRPPARRHAHRHRGERGPLPRLHGPGPRLPLPRHGPLRVLRRRQRQADRDVRRAHRLPPPQAGRPRRARRLSARAGSRSGPPWRGA